MASVLLFLLGEPTSMRSPNSFRTCFRCVKMALVTAKSAARVASGVAAS